MQSCHLVGLASGVELSLSKKVTNTRVVLSPAERQPLNV